MDEPNGEPYSNLIAEFKIESNFIVFEYEPEPCGIA